MIVIVLPAYNEEQSLPRLLERIAACGVANPDEPYQVIVVNDGSHDATPTVALSFAGRLALRLINHDGNKGLGEAIKTGLTAAAQAAADDDAIVTMDADNTHDPALIPLLRAELTRGHDLVIASRYQLGGKEIGLSLPRHVFSRGASLLLRLFFPIRGARDYTCGYRAYRGALLHRALQVYGARLVEEQGFTCMAELLIKLARLNARVAEVPLVLRYDLKQGTSKMNVRRTIARYLVLIARHWRKSR